VNLLAAATAKLLTGINARQYPVDVFARDTRPIHKQLFSDLTPIGHEYYAGTYRGSHQKCLRNYNVEIRTDTLVGAPAPKVFELITRFGTAIVNATAAIDNALRSADNPIDPAERMIAVVRVACDAFVRFLTIHPFADGNGHTARALLWIILVRFDYVPDKWTIEPRPGIPEYGESIAKHRRGDTAPLEQFVLGSISPAA
jgi:fido (protein-threonine AMPylation protein)